MALKPSYTGSFKRDLKLIEKRGKDLEKLRATMSLLAEQKPLEPRFRDHPLSGSWAGHRDCHIEPDWVLIYAIVPEENKIRFERTGTHADLF